MRMLFDWIIIIAWAIVGIINLADSKIQKASYAIMWVVLMLNLIADAP